MHTCHCLYFLVYYFQSPSLNVTVALVGFIIILRLFVGLGVGAFVRIFIFVGCGVGALVGFFVG
jgi:hypothetical protein